jgi:hypothetical protein
MHQIKGQLEMDMEMDKQSVPLVELQTFNALHQVELVEVVESHQVAVPPKDVHLALVYADRLAVTCTGLLSDNKAVAVVVDDLLLQFFVALLVPNRLQRLYHGLSRRRKLTFFLTTGSALRKLL